MSSPTHRCRQPTAATVFGSLSPNLTVVDMVRVAATAMACTAVVSDVVGYRAGRRELGTLHALGCTPPQLVRASAVSQGVLGVVGATNGVPLGLGFYLAFSVASGFAAPSQPSTRGETFPSL
jgi:hypothetical protein